VSERTRSARGKRSGPAAVATPPGAPAVPARGPAPRGRLAALILLLLVAVGYAVSHDIPAVDTYISLAGGRYILAHGISTADPFSFNARRPLGSPAPAAGLRGWLMPTGWINQNWLTHVFFAGIVAIAGLNALAVWKLLNYLLVAAGLVVTARLRRAPWAIALLASAVVVAAGRDFWDIRAQDLSNLFVVLLFLIIGVARRRGPRWIWFIVPLFALWCNVHGGFIYGLLVLALLLATQPLVARRRDRFLAFTPGGFRHLAAAAACALFACVAASPFRLTNLTHFWEITASPDAAAWQNVLEWRPFSALPASSAVPAALFAALTVLAGALALVARRDRDTSGKAPAGPSNGGMRRPFDLAGALIVLVGFVMAAKSQRFTQVALLAAAPFLAGWLAQAWQQLRRRDRQRAGAAGPPAVAWLARRRDLLIWLGVAAATAAFAWRFDLVYLRPYAADFQRASCFDRLTYGYREAYGTCAFLAANRVRGRMWNFWVDGGFFAWCQQPDPATGAIPVRIFIDGRAQANYDVDVMQSYDLLGEGGPAGMAITKAGRDFTPEEAEAAAAWVGRRLGQLGVGLASIPSDRQRTAIARAVFNLPNWQVVYMDPWRTLCADTSTAAGKALADGIDTGSTSFPDPDSGFLTRAYRLLRRGGAGSGPKILALARKAYDLRPSRRAVAYAVEQAGDDSLRAPVRSFCESLTRDFFANRAHYESSPGYAERLLAVDAALEFLRDDASAAGNGEAVHTYSREIEACRDEQRRARRSFVW
jgi:hypothetical protein